MNIRDLQNIVMEGGEKLYESVVFIKQEYYPPIQEELHGRGAAKEHTRSILDFELARLIRALEKEEEANLLAPVYEALRQKSLDIWDKRPTEKSPEGRIKAALEDGAPFLRVMALEVIFKKHYKNAIQFVTFKRKWMSEYDAQDCFGEVCLKLNHKYSEGKHPIPENKGIWSYITGEMRNEYKRLYKGGKPPSQNKLETRLEISNSWFSSLLDETPENPKAKLLNEEFQRLDDMCRNLLETVYYGESFEDIAAGEEEGFPELEPEEQKRIKSMLRKRKERCEDTFFYNLLRMVLSEGRPRLREKAISLEGKGLIILVYWLKYKDKARRQFEAYCNERHRKGKAFPCEDVAQSMEEIWQYAPFLREPFEKALKQSEVSTKEACESEAQEFKKRVKHLRAIILEFYFSH